MSDELFDKLDVIENKSLFIRKLIEREIDMLDNDPQNDITPWTERFATLRDDVNAISNKLKLIEKNFPEINGILENMQNNSDIPIAQEPEVEAVMDNIVLAEDEEIEDKSSIEDFDKIDDTNFAGEAQPAEQQETPEMVEPPIAENKLIEIESSAATTQNTIINDVQKLENRSVELQQTQEETPHEMKLSELVAEKIEKHEPEISPSKIEEIVFVMPELKPPEQAQEIPGFEMPELKLPEQAQEIPGFEMPELRPPEQAQEIPGFEMPEVKPPEQAQEMPGFEMPELRPPEQAQEIPGFVMPELKTPEQAQEIPGFVMPELKTPEQAQEMPGFEMPELKPLEQAQEMPGFVMPELKTPEQAEKMSGFEIPELKPPEQAEEMSGFEMPELKPPVGVQPINTDATQSISELPPMMNTKPTNMQVMQTPPPQPAAPPVTPSASSGSDTKPDKLESNILMYMPRGAKVKKEIIKSLVSRQFSQEDIDRKLQELVAREVLVLKQENGIEQLHRLK
jgi:hypothetical protein